MSKIPTGKLTHILVRDWRDGDGGGVRKLWLEKSQVACEASEASEASGEDGRVIRIYERNSGRDLRNSGPTQIESRAAPSAQQCAAELGASFAAILQESR